MRELNDYLQDDWSEAEKEWNKDVEKFMASQMKDELLANEWMIHLPFPISCIVASPETVPHPNLSDLRGF